MAWHHRLFSFTVIASLAFGIFSAVNMERVNKRKTLTITEYVEYLSSHLQSSHLPFKIIVHKQHFVFNRPSDLVLPAYVLPQAQNIIDNADFLKAIENCGSFPTKGSSKKSSLHQKLFTEWELRCRNKIKIDPRLWRTPPYIHPLGGSWLARFIPVLRQRGQNIDQEHEWLHLIELPRFYPANSDYGIFVENLSLSALSGILKTDHIVYSEPYYFVLLSSSFGEVAYAKLDSHAFEAWQKDQPYQFVSTKKIPTECNQLATTGCWVSNLSWWENADNWRTASLISFLVFLILIGAEYLHLQWRAQRLQLLHEISALAISHEIRHPVTTMSLSIEMIRKELDVLPENLQENVLRIATELQRLQRLMKASETFFYLGREPQSQRHFSPIPVVSFLRRLTSSYGLDLTIAPPLGEMEANNLTLNTDPYWFGLAVENLIKNAIKHGAPPVEITLRERRRFLEIEVLDHGQYSPFIRSSFRGPFSHRHSVVQDEGLGAGLILTRYILQVLDGSLKCSPKPTRFTIAMRT